MFWLTGRHQRHKMCFEKLHFQDLKGNLLWPAHFPFSFLPQHPHVLPSGCLTPPLVSTSVTDSYPFHLDFNYTPTPQFTCQKLLQRKLTHTQKLLNIALPIPHDQLRVWIERIEPNPAVWKVFELRVSLKSLFISAFVFGYAACVILKVAPRLFVFNVWSCTLINLLHLSFGVKRSICLCLCVRLWSAHTCCMPSREQWFTRWVAWQKSSQSFYSANTKTQGSRPWHTPRHACCASVFVCALIQY